MEENEKEWRRFQLWNILESVRTAGISIPVITNSGDVVKQRKQVCLRNAKQIPDVNVLFSDAPYLLDFIDVLDKQFFLVSMEMKRLVEKPEN